MAMLLDLCEQIEAQGVRRILLLNGHGGNTSALHAFQRQWAHRGIAGRPGGRMGINSRGAATWSWYIGDAFDSVWPCP